MTSVPFQVGAGSARLCLSCLVAQGWGPESALEPVSSALEVWGGKMGCPEQR